MMLMNLADLAHADAAHKARIEAIETLAQRTDAVNGGRSKPETFGGVIRARLAALRGTSPTLRHASST